MTMTDEQIALALFRRLLDEEYWDTDATLAGGPRLCVDGTIYGVTVEEAAALQRWYESIQVGDRPEDA